MMPLNKSKWINKLKQLEAAKEIILIDSKNMAKILETDKARADEYKEFQTPVSRKFFNSHEKNNLARIARIEKQIRAHEAEYNKYYRIWRDFEDACIIAEANYDETYKDFNNINEQYQDCKLKLIMAGAASDDAEMRKIGAKLQTLHYDLLQAEKRLETAERKLHALKKRSVQELLPLDIVREKEIIKAAEKIEFELPDALKPIRDAVLKRQNSIIPIEPKSPNPMDEILKSFQSKGDTNVNTTGEETQNEPHG